MNYMAHRSGSHIIICRIRPGISSCFFDDNGVFHCLRLSITQGGGNMQASYFRTFHVSLSCLLAKNCGSPTGIPTQIPLPHWHIEATASLCLSHIQSKMLFGADWASVFFFGCKIDNLNATCKWTEAIVILPTCAVDATTFTDTAWYHCFKKKDYNRLCPSGCSIQIVNFTSSNNS